MLRSRLFYLLFIIVTSAGHLHAQTLPDSVLKRINSLFDYWNKAQSPGCVVGIVRNDTLVFSKGYGMANLEYAIPNTSETLYHLASVSKQFTAYAIILLEQQGKLSLDDDIRKYLPWFPDMHQKITIRNLLNHTSGIRDQWQLLGISGTRPDDVITQEQIIKILSKQQGLNFTPGSKFMYSNSGYTLLAEIVKVVSGRSLREFADSAIFKPLGMNSTHFHNDYTEIEKNRAYSYNRKNNTQFSNGVLSNGNIGPSNLISNIDDLAKWVMNFYNTKAGNQHSVSLLTRNGKFNDGTELDYAAGIISRRYKGWKQYEHDGSDAGYRTFITIFPELKTGIIVLSNLSEINVSGKAAQIADIIIPEKHPDTILPEMKGSVKIPATELPFMEKQQGSYFSNGVNLVMDLKVKDGRLYQRMGSNDYYPMKRDTEQTYSIFYAPDVKFHFKQQPGEDDLVMTTEFDTYHFKRLPDKLVTDDKTLMNYTGVYYSPELDCIYRIVLKNHELYLTNNKYDDTKLTLFGTDDLFNDNWCMKRLTVTRNKSGKVTGLEVNSWRVLHLRFVKINPASLKAYKR
ncbi:MAG TPA: serine hydrolase domain-containing protein [Mucilaginibacter sp.]|nr:serine hydrolase domain-containing protein [Mucilaginibacter sp.]